MGYKKIEPRMCESCGVEFKPLIATAKMCYTCYKKIGKKKSPKVSDTIIPKIKVPRKKIDCNEMELHHRPLNDEEKAKIAMMLGRFNSVKEIQYHFEKKEAGKLINHESIKSIRDSEKWKSVIDKERVEFLAKIQDVPIANKRIRMEGWQTMMEKAYDEKDMKILKSALEGARNEMEGIHIGVPGGNQYSLTYIANMSGNELLQKRDELMSKIKRLTSSIEKEEVIIPTEIKEDILNADCEQSIIG